MEDWWRLNQGYFVFAAFIALLVVGAWARRWSRRFVARAADNAARGVTWDTAGNPLVDQMLQSLATEVRLATDLAGAEALTAAMRLPRWWEVDHPGQWSIRVQEEATTAQLRPLPDGVALVLVQAQHTNGLPVWEKDWRRLRAAVVQAAAAAGVEAHEEPGPALVKQGPHWVRA